MQFVSQPYTSDIDHTGALSEAVVTLPNTVAPKATIDLEIAYEGVIVLDATRLRRIGTPEAIANSTDWDQISAKFTAVRGAGTSPGTRSRPRPLTLPNKTACSLL